MRSKILLYIFILLVIDGCSYRELDHDYTEGALVRINVDWSDNNGHVPSYVGKLEALFYPTDGGPRISRYIDPAGGETRVPIGSYNVIVYNPLTNHGAQSILFRGHTECYTVEAYTNVIRSSRFYSRSVSNDTVVLMRPDSLFSWSNKDLEEIVSTKQGASGKASKYDLTIDVPIMNQVKTISFPVEITNKNSISSIYSIITGMVGSRYLWDNTHNPEEYAVEVALTPNATGYDFHFSTFGFRDKTINDLVIYITTPDGKEHIFHRDITDDIEKIVLGESIKIVVDKVDVVYNGGSGGGGGGGFVPPSVGDWNPKDEEIPVTNR